MYGGHDTPTLPAVKTLVYGGSVKDKLTKADWLEHGLRVLAREGPGALKAEPMAQALQVSRGSFYWHFKNIDDFCTQLLRAWEATSTDHVIEALDARPGDRDRLRELLHRAFAGSQKLDRAVRTWAAADDKVARVVANVDHRRVGRIAQLLVEAGVSSERAAHRALFLYWAFLGQGSVADPRLGTLPRDALSDAAALFEQADRADNKGPSR
jgi:AcrR family transcriptional regulator